MSAPLQLTVIPPPLIWADRVPSLSAMLQEWPKGCDERGGLRLRMGSATMIRLVLHVLMYPCTLAFVTGVVIAAAMSII